MSVKHSNAIDLPVIERDKLAMQPDQPVYISCYAYLENEFANARRYEGGILLDKDTEFLHQYRVCLRRTRAIISLLKELFPAHEKECLSVQLKDLMQKTNLLRDLDVYLMKKDTFFKQLNHKHHSGLAGFFDDIQHCRTAEFDRLCDWLRSGSYQQQCREIEAHLHRILSCVPPRPAKLPCGTYGRKAVWKRFKKVSKRAGNIDVQSEDSEIHKLRIDCKKLRYLLEYFQPLFKKSDYQRELKTLKQLQDYLGDFNDSSVEHNFLSHYLEHKNETSNRYKAVSKLLHLSRKQHHQARTHVLQQLERFLVAQTKLWYQTLC